VQLRVTQHNIVTHLFLLCKVTHLFLLAIAPFATARTLLSSYSRAMLFMGQERKKQKLHGYADILHAHRHAMAKPADI
jgi:hypothetical protein